MDFSYGDIHLQIIDIHGDENEFICHPAYWSRTMLFNTT